MSKRRDPKTPSAEMSRFLSSMTMDLDKWRDGLGYDLDALDELDDEEQTEVVRMLAGRVSGGQGDWYDLEALARVDSPEAQAALVGALRNTNASIRLRAAEFLAEAEESSTLTGDDAKAVEKDIVGLLRHPQSEVGIDLLTRLAEQFDSPAVREALLWCALDGREDLRVHAAALVLYLEGGAEESFDWEQRPLFLKFGENDRKVREAAMVELKRRIDAARG